MDGFSLKSLKKKVFFFQLFSPPPSSLQRGAAAELEEEDHMFDNLDDDKRSLPTALQALDVVTRSPRCCCVVSKAWADTDSRAIPAVV